MIRLRRILAVPYSWLYGDLLWVLRRLGERRANRLAHMLMPAVMAPFRSRLRSNFQYFLGSDGSHSNERFAFLERTHLSYLSALTVSFARLPDISSVELERSTTLAGEEQISAALKLGRGLLLIMDHFGNGWYTLAALASRGYRISMLSNDITLPAVQHHIQRISRRFMVDLVRPGPDAFRKAREVLRMNEIFLLSCDASVPSRNCVGVPFGKSLLQVHLGTGLLALRSGAPMLRITNKVLPSGHSIISVAQPVHTPPSSDPRRDAATLLRSWVRELEEAMMASPEQWFLWGYVPLGSDQSSTGSGSNGRPRSTTISEQ